VRGTQRLNLGTLMAREGSNPATAGDRAQICKTGCEPWPLVIDRLSLTLAESLEASQRPATADRALPLAQDAYFRDFEASGMKMAIRLHLGHDRALRAEELLREITDATRVVVAGKAGTGAVLEPTRRAVLSLAQASGELNRKGVTERSKIFAATSPAFWVDESPSAEPQIQESRRERPAALASVPRLVREGTGAMLLLAVLFALASKSGQPVRRRWLPLGGGIVATAALCVVIGSTGRVGDLLEGVMLLAAAGLLYHAGQRIVSRRGTCRRFEPSPGNDSPGIGASDFIPLGLAAIVVSARDAAETVNVSRSLVAQGETSAVLIGLGLLAGLFVVVVLPATRLRVQALLGLSGALLLALAIVFAGRGVFGLQAAGILKATELGWAGRGLTDSGFRPNLQVAAMQAVLLAGAIAVLGLAGRARVGATEQRASPPPAP